jgi:hypothetical protein
MHSNALRCTAMHCNALWCTAMHCYVLQCTAMYCNALRCTAMHCYVLRCTAMHCDVLQCTVMHCHELQCTVTHCDALRRTRAWQLCSRHRKPVSPNYSGQLSIRPCYILEMIAGKIGLENFETRLLGMRNQIRVSTYINFGWNDVKDFFSTAILTTTFSFPITNQRNNAYVHILYIFLQQNSIAVCVLKPSTSGKTWTRIFCN